MMPKVEYDGIKFDSDLEAELKKCKAKIKDYERFMKYFFKPKLTKKQLHWKQNFEAIWRLKNGCE